MFLPRAVPALVAHVLLSLAPAASVGAQSGPDAAPRLRAGRLTGPISLDGRLLEADWAAADTITTLTQVTPVEGARPAGRLVWTFRFLLIPRT